MQKKKYFYYLILIGLICFFLGIGGAFTYQKWKYENEIEVECMECWWALDSLKRMEYMREDEQLPYCGMKKEEVLEMLPLPKGNYIRTLFDSDTLMNLFWLYNPYKKRLKGTQDTIIVNVCSWEIPYHDRPDLFIVFEKRGKEWIVSTCVQWDSERVLID